MISYKLVQYQKKNKIFKKDLLMKNTKKIYNSKKLFKIKTNKLIK